MFMSKTALRLLAPLAFFMAMLYEEIIYECIYRKIRKFSYGIC